MPENDLFRPVPNLFPERVDPYLFPCSHPLGGNRERVQVAGSAEALELGNRFQPSLHGGSKGCGTGFGGGRELAPLSVRAPLRPRATWPRCGAFCRTTGEPCRARGDGRSGLCRLHGGLTLNAGWRPPLPTWSLRVTPGGVWVAPSRAARTWRKPSWPLRVSWAAAVRLVTNGLVTRGLLHRHEGIVFLAELQRCGVEVLEEGPTSAVRRRVRFEVQDVQASKALAKRRGKVVRSG